jgi:hypothetical protein
MPSTPALLPGEKGVRDEGKKSPYSVLTITFAPGLYFTMT